MDAFSWFHLPPLVDQNCQAAPAGPLLVTNQPNNTIFRTGLLLAASMPVSSSARPALPPQPSWRILVMMSRIRMAPCRS